LLNEADRKSALSRSDVSVEKGLPGKLKQWLSFAQQKLEETRWIAGRPHFLKIFAERRR
jgi:hypothetical protein